MDARRFDDRTRPLPAVSRRRALTLLGGALSGGLAGSLRRRREPLVAQEPEPGSEPSGPSEPAATPGGEAALSPEVEAPPLPAPGVVERVAGDAGSTAPEADLPVNPAAPTPEPGTCTGFVLAGGPDATEPIHVDDDLLLLNDAPIFVDEDGGTNVLAPIPFQAAAGDRLTVVARDTAACGRQIGALWLHCADGGEPRFLSAGQNLGCDEAAQVPENFYRDSWWI